MFASPEVRHCSVEGIVVLMSLQSGDYSLLDRRASAAWSLLLESPAQRADRTVALAAEWQIEPAQAEADIDAFAAQCLQQGLLVERPASIPPEASRAKRPRQRASTARAWSLLVATVLRLRWRGFPATYRCYTQHRIEPRQPGSLNIDRALAAFRTAENFVSLPRAPKDCLPRSLALFRYLRELGFPVEHCLGVRRFPFEAHAWVELQGLPLFNDAADLARYTELARTR